MNTFSNSFLENRGQDQLGCGVVSVCGKQPGRLRRLYLSGGLLCRTAVLLLVAACLSQLWAIPRWVRIFGDVTGGRGTEANDVVETRDGGFVTAGAVSNWENGTYPLFLFKFDSLGDSVWAKQFDSANTIGYAVDSARGGFVATGQFSDEVHRMGNIFLFAADSVGDSLWQRDYTASPNKGLDVLRTSDGGFAIAGRAGEGAGDTADHGYMLKTDSVGDSLWARDLWGRSRDSIYSELDNVIETPDHGFVLTGWLSYVYLNNYCKGWVVRLDSAGNTVWNRTYGWDAGLSCFYAGCPARDGGYVFAGVVDSTLQGVGTSECWMVRTDTAGRELWSRSYLGHIGGIIWDVKPTEDGGYFLTGQIQYGIGRDDGLIIKTDSLGVEQWHGIFQAPDHVYALFYHGSPTTDGGYVASGSLNCNGNAAWIVKTDAEGSAGILSEHPREALPARKDAEIIAAGLTDWPVRIRYFMPRDGSVRIELFDAVGRRLSASTPERQSAGWHSMDLIQARGAGTYFVRLTGQGDGATAKFVVPEHN